VSDRPEPHADRVFRVAKHAPAQRVGKPLTVDVSWRRCLNDYHLDPARRYQPVVLDSQRLRELHEQHADLVHIAKAEMDLLYEQIAASGYALLLADTSGIILCERVDPSIAKSFARAGLIVGAEWSEACEGTNGIGTCVTERRPITIHQADHFRAQHIGLSCSAAPIRDAFGNIIAVLDASSCNARGTREQQMHTVALVNASAGLIEKCLFLRRYRNETILRFHYRPEFVDLLHDGAIAVAADGTIVAADMTASRLLAVKDFRELVGRSFSEVFDARHDELRSVTPAGHRAVWELRERKHGNGFFASCAPVADPIERRQPPRAGRSRSVVRVSRHEAAPTLTLEEIAGEDPQMVRNLFQARRVLNSGIAVLLSGPTGSGKEAFAKAIHAASERADRPFVAVNCAAIPEQLIESELFGYAPGAFTGARREGMRGCIAQSSGGTLFLDEIGDMPLPLQTRLLRVIEDQQVRPLGTDQATAVDLHVISASHYNLRELVAQGHFREDLFYRLNGITLVMPSLAQRRDKETLIRKCIARECGGAAPAAIELEALERLVTYSWPGNMRELRNVVRAASAISDQRLIREDDLPPEIRDFRAAPEAPAAPAVATNAAAPRSHEVSGPLEHAERQALLATIERNEWNMTRTAVQLGLSRATLYRKLRQHHIGVGRASRVRSYD
jgi:sigma-54 dependent transcriptional regulator, acetoin dehydrogenase operon transcriptional activator AcoR